MSGGEFWMRDVMPMVVSWVLGAGPFVVWAGLLNRRDRRQAALLGTVAAQFSATALRSDIALRVRCALWSRAGVVHVDMRGSTREAVWDAVARLRQSLPPAVQLTVEGPVDRRRLARLTVETAGVESLRPRGVSSVSG